MLAKRVILRLPIRPTLSGTIAQYAKTLPKPHQNLIREPEIMQRSRLFDPEILPVPPRRRMTKRHVVESTGMPMPPRRKGDLDRPDKSEQRTNLTFNWSPT